MKFEFYIAKRLNRKDKKKFSRPIVNIATISITLGVAIMIISLSVLQGFQKKITEKIVGFGSHIQIKSFEASNSLEIQPIDKSKSFVKNLYSIEGVKSVQPTATIGGMIKTDDQIQGIVLKGLDSKCDTSFFTENMKEGRFIKWSNDTSASTQIIISSYIALKLKLKLHDKLKVYFLIDNTLRARVFDIVGIYSTSLSTFDERFVIGDIQQVQKLRKWTSNQVETIDVCISDFSKIDEIAEAVFNSIDYNLTLSTVKELYPALFSWLKILDTNTILIFVVMVLVSVVTILSTLLIIIFEKISLIGVLKTLGTTNTSLRKIFLLNVSLIILKGVLYGFGLAILLCVLQMKFQIITLDSQKYFLDYVPIYLNIWNLFIIGLGSLVICVLASIVPTSAIARIQPAKTINVE